MHREPGDPSPVKPLLVGEQNPYGGDPRFALYPAPEGCSGYRLCRLVLGMHRIDYLGVFDRANLCDGPWDAWQARQRGEALWREAVDLARPAVILLGSKVAAAWNVPRGRSVRTFTVETNCAGVAVVRLPHPSGRCLLWNRPGAFARARALVGSACPSVAHLLGVVP